MEQKVLAIIAVLGDLHGHLTLAFRLLRHWHCEHAVLIDCVLQVSAAPALSILTRRITAALQRGTRSVAAPAGQLHFTDRFPPKCYWPPADTADAAEPDICSSSYSKAC